jgi:diguanylate cyclase (GGDEF)-like protein
VTPQLIDMSMTDDRDRQAPAAGPQAELSYVLVADADVQRTAVCLESIKPFKVGVLVARDGEEALGIVHRFGAPVLLITDLSLPRKDGFAVIEAVRDIDAGRTEIIAWSALRELREFAAHRLAGLNVRILSGSVSPSVLRGAIERALRGTFDEPRAVAPPPPTVEDIHLTMASLAERARELSTAGGVAVYFKARGQRQFRAAVTWTSDVPMPDAPPHLPRVFDLVLESRDALVLPDLATQPLAGLPRSVGSDSVRGIVAVPIVAGDDAIVGAICVFDVKPLDIGDAGVNALKALGRAALARPSPHPEYNDTADRPAAVPERPESAHPAEPRLDDVGEVAAPPPFEPVSLLDRRGGGLAIARELARVRREQRQLSLVLFDVDPARAGNQSDRADAPDALEAVSDTLTRAIRGSDLAIQWSRDELLVVLPGLSATEARPVAERVRAAMQAGARHRVSVAGGVAELMTNETVESAVARANEKLRLARERGHNRVG